MAWVACAAAAHTVPPGGWPLAVLEARAAEASPQRALAEADVDVARARRDVLGSASGARLVGAASLGSVREAVTADAGRQYERGTVQAGVRWPLWGSRRAHALAEQAGIAAVAVAQHQSDEAGHQARRALRSAWVRWMRATERAGVADAFGASRPASLQHLAVRDAAGYMLPAERLDLVALYDDAAAEARRQRVAADTARRGVARLAGIGVDDALLAQPLPWRGACAASAPAWRDSGATAVARTQLQQSAAAEPLRGDLLEAGVQLTHSASRDVGGQPGRATVLAVDIGLPLGWHAAHDARRAAWTAERTRAELLVQQRSDADREAAEAAWAAWAGFGADRAADTARLAAAREGLRVALLRLPVLDGDGFSRAIMARHALYQAALRAVAGLEQQELAQVDLLDSAPDCAGTDAGPLQAVPDAVHRALRGDDALQAGAAPAALRSAGQRKPASPTRAVPERGGLGWFVWDSAAWLRNPARLDRLPAGSTGVMVSLDGRQLAAARTPAGARRLTALRDAAWARGLRFELLLGDPDFVRPPGRDTLIAHLGALAAFRFDAVQLDLERSQVPPEHQAQWPQDVLATLRAASAATAMPVGLVTHHRDLADPAFLAALQAAGVRRITPMVYATNPQRVDSVLETILQARPDGLDVAVAQSIEPGLGADESSFAMGRRSSLRAWQALRERWAGRPGFAGVAVQAWGDFQQASP